jgi:hypothetical protein
MALQAELYQDLTFKKIKIDHLYKQSLNQGSCQIESFQSRVQEATITSGYPRIIIHIELMQMV